MDCPVEGCKWSFWEEYFTEELLEKHIEKNHPKVYEELYEEEDSFSFEREVLEEKKVYFGFVTGAIGFFLGGYIDVLVGEMLFWLLFIPSAVFVVVLFLESLKESLRTYFLMSIGGFLIGLLAGMMVL